MIDAVKASGKKLAINWPLVWVPAHRTAKRLIGEGVIGHVIEVRHYGGNRGPLYDLADKVEVTEAKVQAKKPESWFYSYSVPIAQWVFKRFNNVIQSLEMLRRQCPGYGARFDLDKVTPIVPLTRPSQQLNTTDFGLFLSYVDAQLPTLHRVDCVGSTTFEGREYFG